ncbi:uncharacterized protein [Ambystoma mexicanum]|uniref:uncharacterized protein n=1 Tax=Ambystoma mexicanum TaxID=8296 RepID=UPI0037E7A9BF
MGDAKEGRDYTTHMPTSQETNENVKHHVQSSGSTDGKKAPERKHGDTSTKLPSTGSTHQKKTHGVDKTNHSSTVINPVDLSVFGRSNSTLSSMTVPIRLDALSYLLNNALMGAYRMPPPVPVYGNQCAVPMCQSGAQLYSNPMGQVAQTSCAGHACCPAHFTAQVYPTAQMCTVQPQVCPGNMCQDSSRLLGRPAGSHNETTILYPPAVQRDPNGTSWNTSEATQNNANVNVTEPNKWQKLAETSVERPTSNFVQPKSSFSGGSDGQNSPPKRTFGNSSQGNFGSWKDNGRGNSWSGRQQRDFDRPMGRSNDNFSSGSWRGNSREQSRDSGFGGRPWNSDFGNRKRNLDEGSGSQDEGQGFKQGRWSGGRGRGGGRGSWQQRTDDSTAHTETGNFGDRFKSSTNTTSGFGVASSFNKNDNSNEDWETSYKSENPEKLNTSAPKLLRVTVDKKPEYHNSTLAATTNAGLATSFSAKDNSSDDWETDYKSEQSSKATCIVPCSLDQKQVEATKPHLSNFNTDGAEVAFETTPSGTLAEAIQSVDNKTMVKGINSSPEECSTTEPDKEENGEKAVSTYLSAMIPKVDTTGQSTSAELTVGEFNGSSESLDAENTDLTPTDKTPELISNICSPPSSSSVDIFSTEKVQISKSDTIQKGISNFIISETFETPKDVPPESQVSVAICTTNDSPPKSSVSEALEAQVDIPYSSPASETVDKQDVQMQTTDSVTVDSQLEFPNKDVLSERVHTHNQNDLQNSSAFSGVVETQNGPPCISTVLEGVGTQEEFPIKSATADEVDNQKDLTETPAPFDSVDKQKEVTRESSVLHALVSDIEKKPVLTEVAIAQDIPRSSADAKAVDTQNHMTNKCEVSEALNTNTQIPNTPTVSEGHSSHEPFLNTNKQTEDGNVLPSVSSTDCDNNKDLVTEKLHISQLCE